MSEAFINGDEIVTLSSLNKALQNGIKTIKNDNTSTIAQDAQSGLTFFYGCKCNDLPEEMKKVTPSFMVLTFVKNASNFQFEYQFIFHDSGNIYFRASWNGVANFTNWRKI